MHQDIRGFDETPIMATSRDPRCAIAISTAIIRLLINTDPRLATSLGTAVSNRGPHIRDNFQKTESTWNGETDFHLYTMSALPQKQTFVDATGMSALCQKATPQVAWAVTSRDYPMQLPGAVSVVRVLLQPVSLASGPRFP